LTPSDLGRTVELFMARAATLSILAFPSARSRAR
jgi:hypothetical protein